MMSIPNVRCVEGEMTAMELIATGGAILFLLMFGGYALRLLDYALSDDEVIRERLRQVTR
jgi:hypothetical protein